MIDKRIVTFQDFSSVVPNFVVFGVFYGLVDFFNTPAEEMTF
jgi:hypothetical protein